MYEYGARWYDPAIGRFIGVDPIADQFAWVSVYNYAENEPVRHIDLHGLQKYDPQSGQMGPWANDYVEEQETYQQIKETTVTEQVADNNAQYESEAMMAIMDPMNVALVVAPIVGAAETEVVVTLAKAGKAAKTLNDFRGAKLSDKKSAKTRGGSRLREQKSDDFKLLHTESEITNAPGYNDIKNLSDSELINAARHPADGNFIKVNTNTGKVTDGNTRLYELRRRGMNVDVPYEHYTPNNSYFFDF